VSLPVAADLNFYLSERRSRALCRARMFLTFRRRPELQQRLLMELEELRRDTLALDTALRQSANPVSA
jgi:hypothetical protein